MAVQKIIDEVISSCCFSGSARQDVIMKSLISHLHGFVADVKPSDEEWMAAIQFLTSVGQKCDDKRQEFILLSDILGVTALKDTLNNSKPEGATEASVLGPFYREGVGIFANGESISRGESDGELCVVRGRVTDINGNPIQNAIVDVWQSDSNGFYEQQDENQPEMNLRGVFRTDNNGEYWLKTVRPKFYPIPTDGPVGQLLKMLGRHEFRPAHIHFIVSSPGYEKVTTQYFDRDSNYIDSDAVFGVRDSLVIDFVKCRSELEIGDAVIPSGTWMAECNFVLTQGNSQA